jgi:hypothetical protein
MPRDLRKLIPLGSVIAERELSFNRPGEATRIIRARIGAPVPDPAYPSSALCPIVVDGFDKEEKLVLGGVDTMQALVFGLQALTGFLRLCAKQHRGTLTWLDSPDLGFPEPTEPPGTAP